VSVVARGTRRAVGWIRASGPVIRQGVRHRTIVIGGGLVLLVALVALGADFIAPHDPLQNNFRARLQPPDASHWFGTDHFGRDILSRVIFGGRLSLEIGLLVVVMTGIFGTLIGGLAGYFRALDNPIMRLMDALMAFPAILLAITVSATLGASVTNVVIALSIATTPHTARIVRASVLVVREMQYVEAARALGASDLRILVRHVLANSLAPLIVRLTFVFATIIAWSYYGEKAAEYLFGSGITMPYRWAWVVMVFIGSILSLNIVWTFADIANGIMIIPNLISLIALSGVVVAETKKYLWDEKIMPPEK